YRACGEHPPPQAKQAEESRQDIAHSKEVAAAHAIGSTGELELEVDGMASLFGHRLLEQPSKALDQRPDDALPEWLLQLQVVQRNHLARFVEAQPALHDI